MSVSENNNVKMVVADPSALGLFGLAMVTLVAGSYKMGLLSGLSLVVPVALILGGIAQLMAGIYDFKHNNVFGATAFSAYALFWIVMALNWMVGLGVFGEGMKAAVDPKSFGIIYFGYLIFSVIMTIGSLETNKMLVTAFILIDFLFVALTLASFGFLPKTMGGLAAVIELAISFVGFYGFAGNVLNRHFGQEFILLGKPLGRFKA